MEEITPKSSISAFDTSHKKEKEPMQKPIDTERFQGLIPGGTYECSDLACISAIETILGQTLTNGQRIAVLKSRQKVIPDRVTGKTTEENIEAGVNFMNEALAPYGLKAAPRFLADWESIKRETNTNRQVIAILGINTYRGIDVHAVHVRSFDIPGIVPCDNNSYYRSDFDQMLQLGQHMYTKHNAWIIFKPQNNPYQEPPFPGRPSSSPFPGTK